MTENDSHDGLRSIRVTDPATELSVLDPDTGGIQTVLDSGLAVGRFDAGTTLPILGGGDAGGSAGLSVRDFVTLVFRRPLREAADTAVQPPGGAGSARHGGAGEGTDREQPHAVGRDHPLTVAGNDASGRSGDARPATEEHGGDSGGEQRELTRRERPARQTPPPQTAEGPQPVHPSQRRERDLSASASLSVAGHRSLPALRSDRDSSSSRRRSRPSFRYRTTDETSETTGETTSSGPTRVERGDRPERQPPSDVSQASDGSVQRADAAQVSSLSVQQIDPGRTAVSTPIRPTPVRSSDSGEGDEQQAARLTPARGARRPAERPHGEPSGEARSSQRERHRAVGDDVVQPSAAGRTEPRADPTGGRPGSERTAPTRRGPSARRTVPGPVAFTYLSGPRPAGRADRTPDRRTAEQPQRQPGSAGEPTASPSGQQVQRGASAEPAHERTAVRPPQGVDSTPRTVLTPFEPGPTAPAGGPRVVERQAAASRPASPESRARVSLTPLARSRPSPRTLAERVSGSTPDAPRTGDPPAASPGGTGRPSVGDTDRPVPGPAAARPRRSAIQPRVSGSSVKPRVTERFPKMTVATHFVSPDRSAVSAAVAPTQRQDLSVESPQETEGVPPTTAAGPLRRTAVRNRRSPPGRWDNASASDGELAPSDAPRMQPRIAPPLSGGDTTIAAESGDAGPRQMPVSAAGEHLIQTRPTERTVRSNEKMPSLTLQANETVQRPDTPDSGASRGPSPSSQTETSGAQTGGEERQAGSDRRSRTAEFAERVEEPTTSQQRGRSDAAGGPSTPPEGREAATMYPELTVKTLAPRIDVTRRAESRRDITHRSQDQLGQSGRPEQESLGTADLGGREGLSGSPDAADIDRMADRLYRELERKRRIERERRGL